MINTTLDGKPHGRFDEGNGVSAKPRGASLFDKMAKKLLALVGVLVMIGGAQATDRYSYAKEGGTANLGAETHLNFTGSADRLVIFYGTVNLNAGASIVVGGNTGNCCNFLGVDPKGVQNSAATLNVNGGLFRCTTAGGGSGFLRMSANNFNQTATLNINSGLVQVDSQLWTCSAYNNANGQPGRGVININGGDLVVTSLMMGTDTDSTGSTEVSLKGGTLSAKSIDFRSYNKQLFQWSGGRLKALQADVFFMDRTYAGAATRVNEVIVNTTSIFDNNGFNQKIPPLTGTGTLRLMGTGIFTFAEPTLSYKLELAGTTLAFGEANATTPLLTVGGAFAVTAPSTVNLTLPAGATGRYPIIAGCTDASAYAVAHLLTSPLGAFVLDNDTIYLDVGAAPADGLIYSAAAGGDDTPEATAYSYAAFLPTAGAFSVGGEALTLNGKGTVIGTQSGATQTIAAPVAFANANAGIYTAAGSTLVLGGGLTATTPVKDGPGTLVLGSTPNPASLTMADGTIDLGGQTVTGSMTLKNVNGLGRTVTYKNGTLSQAYEFNVLCGYDVHFGEGFNLDLTNANGGRLTVGWLNVWPKNEANLYLDPGCGTVTLRGNASNTCNFITPDSSSTGRVVVAGGVLHAVRGAACPPYGCFRIGAGTNPMTTGILKVCGGEVIVDWDLSLATLFNSLDGGAATAEVDLESGTMRVGYFYLGGNTSNVGKGTVRLTGGDLYVKMFKCWGRCTQTLVCDGARIHALQDSVANIPFMTAFANADTYPKSYTIGANGLLIDTAGHKVSCDIPFTGVGGITVTGEGGILTNAVNAAYTGGLALERGVRVVYPAGFVPKDVSVATNAVLQVTAQEEVPTTLGVLTFAEGAKLEIDVSALSSATATVVTEGFVVPDGRGILDFVGVKDDVAGQPRYTVLLEADEKTLTLVFADPTVPYFANWVGQGDPANARDSANWQCFNAVNEELPGALPGPLTTVRLSGAAAFNVPANQPITNRMTVVTGSVTLAADCDWRGLGPVTVSKGTKVDLRGHKLFVSSLQGAGEVTDSSIDYVPLECLESTGAEYINTGYRHTAATRIECVFEARRTQPGAWAALFGARDTTYQTSAYVFFVKSGMAGNLAAFCRSGEETTGDALPYDTKVSFTSVGREASWSRCDDPTVTGHITTGGTPDLGVNDLFLFNLNMGTGPGSVKPDGSYARIRLYSFKIYEGDTLMCDFVPRRRGSDGAAGLWDQQRNLFFTNQGSNEFLGTPLVNDATAYGELHIDVPVDATQSLQAVPLTGGLKVVKEGAGTLAFTDSRSRFFGGIEIAQGTLLALVAGDKLGALGTTVEVDSGATLDINGYGGLYYHDVVLNGGTVANTRVDVAQATANFARVRLTADSFMNAPYRFGLHGLDSSAVWLDIGDHTLSVNADWDYYFQNVIVTGTGTIKVKGGFLNVALGPVYAPEASFDIDSTMSLSYDIVTSNLVYRRNNVPYQPGTMTAYGNGCTHVTGTFTPVTDYFHNVCMENGSTLDVSEKTNGWSVTSLNVDRGTHKVFFATNATVTVGMGSRKIPSEWVYALTWGSEGVPDNLDTLAFKVSGRYARGAIAKADATGVKVCRVGFILYLR